MRKGLIIRLISGDYKVYDIDTKETVIAKPRGIFRIKEEAPKVGDYVEYEIIDGVAIINKINKRNAICKIFRAEFYALLTLYRNEFMRIEALTSASARIRLMASSLSAWCGFWLTSFT